MAGVRRPCPEGQGCGGERESSCKGGEGEKENSKREDSSADESQERR